MFQPRKYKKKELLEIFRTRNDNALLALIDSLWREYPAQWKEQKLSLADIDKADPMHADYDPRYIYARNNFRNADETQTTSYATAHGFGHVARADFAQVFGFFNYALSFFQTVLGPFAKIPTGQTPDEWINTDLLYVLGNGQDDLNRSNVVEIFKSGLVHWHNAQVIGAYKHGNEGEPAPDLIPGLLQYTSENELQFVDESLTWRTIATQQWVTDNFGNDKTYEHDQPTAASSWTITHNLGKNPAVTVVDTAGSVVEGKIEYVNNNQVIITFNTAFSGVAYCN